MIPPPTPAAASTAQADIDLLNDALMDPSAWQAKQFEAIGFRPDLMEDIAWRSRHDTPPPRPEIPKQPQLRDLPQRIQTLQLGQSLAAAGMPVTIRPEFHHPFPGGNR
jgi:hypothetical protein